MPGQLAPTVLDELRPPFISESPIGDAPTELALLQILDSLLEVAEALLRLPGNGRSRRELLRRWGIPVAVAVILALIPAPTGLKENAWHFFALFAGIVAALVLEPIPPAATGVVAITLGALLSRWTLFSPDELANPKFKAASDTVKWAFSGFASNTVWLVGGPSPVSGWRCCRCIWCRKNWRAEG
jgi:hypothetical protein